MKKRICYSTCGILLVISTAIAIYCKFVLRPISMQTFVISPLQIVNSYAAKPVFWLCLGIIGALVFVQLGPFHRFRRLILWSGLFFPAMYAICALCYFSETLARVTYPVLWFFASYHPLFLVFGILIGAGWKELNT